jgi:steroid delta-isomerase
MPARQEEPIMPDPDRITDVFLAYADAMTRNDFAAAVALFTADAVVRDPIDGPPLEGTGRIRDFFASGAGVLQRLTVTGPVRIAGDGRQAAAPFQARLDFGDGAKTLESIDVMTFDEQGRVTSMDAYYGPTNLRDA